MSQEITNAVKLVIKLWKCVAWNNKRNKKVADIAEGFVKNKK